MWGEVMPAASVVNTVSPGCRLRLFSLPSSPRLVPAARLLETLIRSHQAIRFRHNLVFTGSRTN